MNVNLFSFFLFHHVLITNPFVLMIEIGQLLECEGESDNLPSCRDNRHLWRSVYTLTFSLNNPNFFSVIWKTVKP